MLPLPLTLMEHFYWVDDNDAYPTTFPMRLRFSGQLNRDAFYAAVRDDLARHPMLSWQIDPSGRWPHWVHGAVDLDTIIDWQDDDRPIHRTNGERIDLEREIGLRVWVRRRDDQSHVLIQCHHACSDGLGAIRFAEDLLVHYAHHRAAGSERPEPRPVNLEDLKYRGAFGRYDPETKVSMSERWFIAKQWTRLLWRKPTLVAAGRSDDTHREPEYLALETHRLDAEMTLAIKRAAAEKKVTQNDFLLAGLFRTLREWNLEHGDGRDGWLRINMPASLRTREDRRMPAANKMSFAFLTHHSKACDQDDKLLDAIAAETEAIKQYNLSMVFVSGLAFAAGLPGLVPWALRRKRSFATAVLSNVGRVFARVPLPRDDGRVVCGDVILEEFQGVPPIRPHTRTAFLAFNYAGTQRFCLRADPRFFDPQSARQLLARYVAQLRDASREMHCKP